MTGAGIGSTGTPAGSRISWLPNGAFVLPNLYDVDLRLIKQVSFKERYHFELRLEAFNLFNSTLVQLVNTNAYSYTKPGAAIGTGTCPGNARYVHEPIEHLPTGISDEWQSAWRATASGWTPLLVLAGQFGHR